MTFVVQISLAATLIVVVRGQERYEVSHAEILEKEVMVRGADGVEEAAA